MVADAGYVKERDELERLGVPDHVIDYVLAQRPSKLIYNTVLVVGLVLTIMGSFGIVIFTWIVGQRVVDANALARALSENAIFFKNNIGIFAFFGFIAGIFLFGALLVWINFSTRWLRASQFVYTVVQKHNQKYLPKKEKREALATISDPELYMIKLVPNTATAMALVGVSLMTITIAAYSRDIVTYEIITPKDYIATPWFPWDDEVRMSWVDAERVKVGCGRFGGGSRVRYEIVYRVEFLSGRRVWLGEAKPVQGRWLDNITTIDRMLVDQGVAFEQWRGDPPLHPECLKRVRREYRGEDLTRVYELMRIGSIN